MKGIEGGSRVDDTRNIGDKKYHCNLENDIFYHGVIPCRNEFGEAVLMEVLAFSNMTWESIWKIVIGQRRRARLACPLAKGPGRCSLCERDDNRDILLAESLN